MKLFVLIHDPVGDRVTAYDGMDQPTVTGLQAFPFDFIAESAYNSFIAANTPPPLTPAQLDILFKSAAVNLINAEPTPDGKALRGLLLVLIDEFNILRQRDRDRAADVAAAATFAALKTAWAARPALNDRNSSQIKPAIDAKINAGA